MNPTAYEFKPLGDEIEAATVGHVGPMAERYVETGIPFLRSQNIKPNAVSFTDVKFIDEKFHGELKKSSLKAGDVAVVRTGYPGTAAVVTAEMLPMNCADLVIITPGKKVDSRYLASLLNSNFGKALVTGNTVGAAQQHFNVTTAKQIKMPLPPLNVQQKIAAILTAYDDLIENNRQRIALLEKMAEEIYREWFVRLRFPGHEHTPMHKGVPEGWEVVSVGSLVKRIPPGTLYDQKSALTKGSVPILDQGKQGIIGYHNDDPGAVASLKCPLIVFANHTCYQRLIFHPFSAIQNVLPFVPEDEDTNIYWLHFATKDCIEFSEYKGHWPAFIATNVFKPKMELTRSFGEIISPMLHQSYALNKINQLLANTRDLLLNRLISGKLRVDDLDIQFPPSMQEDAA